MITEYDSVILVNCMFMKKVVLSFDTTALKLNISLP